MIVITTNSSTSVKPRRIARREATGIEIPFTDSILHSGRFGFQQRGVAAATRPHTAGCRFNRCSITTAKASPPTRANSSEAGSGTAAGLPAKPALAANAVLPIAAETGARAERTRVQRQQARTGIRRGRRIAEADANSSAARPTRGSPTGSRPSRDRWPPERSIAAMRFSSTWPVVLLIAPEAIADWIAVKGSLSAASPSLTLRAGVAAQAAGDGCRIAAGMAAGGSPAGAIVTVEPALIVSEFCRYLRGRQIGGVHAVADDRVAVVGGRAADAGHAADRADHLVRAGDVQRAAVVDGRRRCRRPRGPRRCRPIGAWRRWRPRR